MEFGTVADVAPKDPDTSSTTGTSHGEADTAIHRGPCQRPIDLVHLARYTLGNKALEREILDLFVNQSLLILQRLEAASTDKEWRDQAHALLGSAKAVGASRVADRALAAQKLPGTHASSDRPAVLAAIGRELETANRYIRDLFPEE